jgi:methylated-DNA-[protein]-cysteine S-methyltransferase
VRYARLPSPIGELVVCGDDGCVAGVYYDPHRGRAPVQGRWIRDDGAFADAAVQLQEWFAGARTRFDLELAPTGTLFQHEVWLALEQIPYGTTVTYTELAAIVGTPSARAVGSANARNPISIIVPCHRVIGTGGSLTGYAGGVERKRWLLEHEASVMAGMVGDLSLQP